MQGARTSVHLLLSAALLALRPLPAAAMCNFIPATTRDFASTVGAVDRPYASPGRLVRLTLGACDDGDLAFVPGATTVTVDFTPPQGPPASVVLPPDAIVAIEGRSLVFAFPDTSAAPGLPRTGPARIRIDVSGVETARIEGLGERDADCTLRADPTFPGFTALPEPNPFHLLAEGTRTEVAAAIDVAGNLLVPFDWSSVFPPGLGFDPIARFVRAGQSSLEAFPAPDPRAGRGIVVPSAAYLSSHTAAGSLLPPFLEVGPIEGDGPFPGTSVAGSVDSLDGVLRFARHLGNDPATEIFDLATRMAGGVGPIVIGDARGHEGPLVDLRTMRASANVIGFEEPPASAFIGGGLFLFDTRSGGLGRIPPAPRPRRFAVSDELAAFYDPQTDASLSVYDLATLTPAPDVVSIPLAATVATGLSGRYGIATDPALGTSIVGGFAPIIGVAMPRVFDVATGTVDDGRPVGGRDLIERADGIVDRQTGAVTPFGSAPQSALAPLGPGVAGRVFAVGNRAIFSACAGPCTPESDRVLMLREPDGSVRELARNVGAPFLFTGRLVGLVFHEDAAFGSAASGADDLNRDGTLDATLLRVYDLHHDRLLTPSGPGGVPLPIPAVDLEARASEAVLVLVVDERDVGSLTCDADAADRVVLLFNGETGALLNTRQPATAGHGNLTLARGLLSFLQPEDMFGRPLGDLNLFVTRDSDGDEIPDPLDNCPLAPNLAQANHDGTGAGDACDPACAGGTCLGAAPPEPSVAPGCRRRVHRATRRLLSALLRPDRACPTCPPVVPARDARAATRTLRQCTHDQYVALGLCADTGDALVGSDGAGCLAAAVRDTVRAAVEARGAAAAAACTHGIARTMAAYAKARHRVLGRCYARRLGTDRGEADARSCAAESTMQDRLAGAGRQARRRIARACGAGDLAGTLCGRAGDAGLDDLVSADGRTGCLLTTYAAAVDRVMAFEAGATPPPPFVSVPCPPQPAPVPTATPAPGQLLVRLDLESPNGAVRSRVAVGHTGFFHENEGLGGAEIQTDLACIANEPTCAIGSTGLAGTALGAPMPMSGGGVPVCIVLTHGGEVAGEFDTAQGDLEAALAIDLDIFTGLSPDQPCPACITAAGTPSVGDVGICSGGSASGGPCRVDGVAGGEFGAGAGTSRDCPLASRTGIAQLRIATAPSTGETRFATSPASPNCRAFGFTGQKCHCDVCDNDTSTACRTDADCPVVDGLAGTCRGQVGEPTRPNSCSDAVCTPTETGGRCLGGPFDGRCIIERFRFCIGTEDCPRVGDECTYEARPCFTDVIVRTGAADPAHPTLAGAFCMAPTASSAVNAAAGLPGPGVYVLPTTTQFSR